ncbi:uncharacterized protein MEPE_02333 [Melanopsichium pennsylvanicum]|uniref:Uncharacterized protein n=2 Tax=Melanopsichium pennsylvanicum TaxID=63383 RepID=A0AAJ5C4F0_9BASI|nr:uncharacterized protein BN887_03616 [Melanopsichium pennsylvanicum 4]SNX83626.1 uncharacterized protein MEPE_02333 [Melanopsichium pennsylvanicum]
MNSEGSSGRGRPSHPRGHRPYRGPYRGGGGDRGRGRSWGQNGHIGGERGGHGGRGGGLRGARVGTNGRGRPPAPFDDPSMDPALAPKPPHPGYFHTSFVENPWCELEDKLGIPHIKSIVSEQRQPAQKSVETVQSISQQPSEATQQTDQATESRTSAS